MGIFVTYAILLFLGTIQLLFLYRSSRKVENTNQAGSALKVCVFINVILIIFGVTVLISGITCQGSGCGAFIVFFIPIFISIPLLMFTILIIMVNFPKEITENAEMICYKCKSHTDKNYSGTNNVLCQKCT